MTPAFAYPPAIQRILTTTNAIREPAHAAPEDLKTRGHFPTDEAATKRLYLALRNINKRWAPAPAWQAVLTHFAVPFPERFIPDLMSPHTPHRTTDRPRPERRRFSAEISERSHSVLPSAPLRLFRMPAPWAILFHALNPIAPSTHLFST